MSENIADALAKEIKRNQELLEVYRDIPTGVFGATMIKEDIDFAIDALAGGDIVEILKAYKRMVNNE